MTRDEARLGILLVLVGGMMAVLYGGLVGADGDIALRPSVAGTGVFVAVVAVFGFERLDWRPELDADPGIDSNVQLLFPIGGTALGYGLPYLIGWLLPDRVVRLVGEAFVNGAVGVCLGLVVAGVLLLVR